MKQCAVVNKQTRTDSAQLAARRLNRILSGKLAACSLSRLMAELIKRRRATTTSHLLFVVLLRCSSATLTHTFLLATANKQHSFYFVHFHEDIGGKSRKVHGCSVGMILLVLPFGSRATRKSLPVISLSLSGAARTRTPERGSEMTRSLSV